MNFKRALLLLRLLVKGADYQNGSLKIGRLKKRKLPVEGPLIYLFVGGIMIFNFFHMGQGLGTTPGLLSVLLPYACVAMVAFGFVTTVTIFYQGDEHKIILSLPFSSSEIVLARFAQVYLYMEIFNLTCFTAFFLGYGWTLGMGMPFYLGLGLSALFLPVTGLSIMIAFIMVLMRFTKLFRNKDRFMMVSSITVMVLVLAGSMALNNLNVESLTGSSRYMHLAFPGSSFLAKGMEAQSLLDGLLSYGLYLLFVLGLIAFVAVMAHWHYLKGLTQSNKGSGKKKHRRPLRAAALAKTRSPLAALRRREMRVLLRTPAYFLNNLSIMIVMPLVLIFPMLVVFFEAKGAIPLSELLSALAAVKEQLSFVPAIFTGAAVAMGFFIGCTNGLASGCITREGGQALLMKQIPISLGRQVYAKAQVAFGISLLGGIIFYPLLLWLAPTPLWSLVFVLLSFMSLAVCILYGVALDCYRPKLDWTNEVQATKRNFNAMIHMAFGMGLAVLTIYLIFKFGMELTFVQATLLLSLALLLLFGLGLYLLNLSLKRFGRRLGKEL